MTLTSGQTPNIRHSLHDSIHMIHREDWTHVTKDSSLYLQYDYLRALEDAMKDTLEFHYAIYYSDENQPMGVAYFQVLDLVDNGSRYREAVNGLGKGIGSRIIRDMKVRSIVNGNVFHCGDHGSHFKNGVKDPDRLQVVADTMRKLDKGCYTKPRASVLIFKELWPQQFGAAEALTEERYYPLTMDVNMVMQLDPAWKKLDHYQDALNSKARTRIRAVLTRSEKLEIKSMSAAEILKASPRLQDLFDQVLERSPFTFGRLNVSVYAEWKKQLGDRLLFRGFYLDGILVGFTSAYVLGDTLDVQYVGFEQELNQAYAIYQRMLVDLLDHALHDHLRVINFGRTAEQAKSNLGALPVEMRFYVKHHNRLANKLVGPFLRSVKPAEFEQRSPFKKSLD